MSNRYKWGIISTGKIANQFAEALNSLHEVGIYAVASRSQETADKFAHKWSVKKSYGSYDELFRDEDVDIVYVGTPHNYHHQNVMDALRAGKHVLCEKPMAINASQGREMVHLARENGLFLMDAMWNRFQPWYEMVKGIIDSDQLGELLHLKADLSFKFPFDAKHRLFNMDLAGGALLDLGVYPIALASLFFGKPTEIFSTSHTCETGADDQDSMVFEYENGATAALGCSSRYTSKNNATLHGSKGFLEIHGMIVRPEKITLHIYGQAPEVFHTPYEVNGYQYEAQAVMDMLDKGKLEHPLMTLDETIEILEAMDQIRSNAGIYYPGEKSPELD